MRVYRSAVLLAILILATPGAYLFDASQTWGWPKRGDKIQSEDIIRTGKWFTIVTFNATLKMENKINCVKFWDKTKTGATVWMSDEPPCFFSIITITSARGAGFHFRMEVFHEG